MQAIDVASRCSTSRKQYHFDETSVSATMHFSPCEVSWTEKGRGGETTARRTEVRPEKAPGDSAPPSHRFCERLFDGNSVFVRLTTWLARRTGPGASRCARVSCASCRSPLVPNDTLMQEISAKALRLRVPLSVRLDLAWLGTTYGTRRA